MTMKRVKTAKKELSGAQKRKAAREQTEVLNKYPKISEHFEPKSLNNDSHGISTGSGNFEVAEVTCLGFRSIDNVVISDASYDVSTEKTDLHNSCDASDSKLDFSN